MRSTLNHLSRAAATFLPCWQTGEIKHVPHMSGCFDNWATILRVGDLLVLLWVGVQSDRRVFGHLMVLQGRTEPEFVGYVTGQTTVAGILPLDRLTQRLTAGFERASSCENCLLETIDAIEALPNPADYLLAVAGEGLESPVIGDWASFFDSGTQGSMPNPDEPPALHDGQLRGRETRVESVHGDHTDPPETDEEWILRVIDEDQSQMLPAPSWDTFTTDEST